MPPDTATEQLHDPPDSIALRPELRYPAIGRGQVFSIRAGALADDLAARRRYNEEPAARIAARCLTEHFAMIDTAVRALAISPEAAEAVYRVYHDGVPSTDQGLRSIVVSLRFLLACSRIEALAVVDACRRIAALDPQGSTFLDRARFVGLVGTPAGDHTAPATAAAPDYEAVP